MCLLSFSSILVPLYFVLLQLGVCKLNFHTLFPIVFPFVLLTGGTGGQHERMVKTRFLVLTQNEAGDGSCYSSSGAGVILDPSSPRRTSNFLLVPTLVDTAPLEQIQRQMHVSPTHLQQLKQVHWFQLRDISCF